MHFGRFKTAEEGMEHCATHLTRKPEKHAVCFCGRQSWMEDPARPGWTIPWGEYASGRNGEDPVKLKGKIDQPCLSALRRNCPKMKRTEAEEKYKFDNEWRTWFEGKRGVAETALVANNLAEDCTCE